jgi:hypothetical protein
MSEGVGELVKHPVVDKEQAQGHREHGGISGGDHSHGTEAHHRAVEDTKDQIHLKAIQDELQRPVDITDPDAVGESVDEFLDEKDVEGRSGQEISDTDVGGVEESLVGAVPGVEVSKSGDEISLRIADIERGGAYKVFSLLTKNKAVRMAVLGLALQGIIACASNDFGGMVSDRAFRGLSKLPTIGAGHVRRGINNENRTRQDERRVTDKAEARADSDYRRMQAEVNEWSLDYQKAQARAGGSLSEEQERLWQLKLKGIHAKYSGKFDQTTGKHEEDMRSVERKGEERRENNNAKTLGSVVNEGGRFLGGVIRDAGKEIRK